MQDAITIDELRREADLLGRPVPELTALSILIAALRLGADGGPVRLARDARLLLDDPTRDPCVQGGASPREGAEIVETLLDDPSPEIRSLLDALRCGEDVLPRARESATELFAVCLGLEPPSPPKDEEEPEKTACAQSRGENRARARLHRAVYADTPRAAEREKRRLRRILGERAENDADLILAGGWLREQTPRLKAEAAAAAMSRWKIALTALPLVGAGVLSALLMIILAASGGSL